jgi:hypothetical protein
MNAFCRICRRFFHGDDAIENALAIISLPVDGVLEQVRGIVLAGMRLEKLGCNSGSSVVAGAWVEHE